MIQRRQSLYLLLTVIIAAILIIVNLPVFKGTLEAEDHRQYNYSILISSTRIEMNPLIVFKTYNIVYSLIISALISVLAILLYKKQGQQLKLVALNFLTLGICLFFLVYNYYQLINLKGVNVQSTQYQATLILPLLLLVLNILAYRGIKKDMELLASVNRLR